MKKKQKDSILNEELDNVKPWLKEEYSTANNWSQNEEDDNATIATDSVSNNGNKDEEQDENENVDEDEKEEKEEDEGDELEEEVKLKLKNQTWANWLTTSWTECPISLSKDLPKVKQKRN